MAKALLGLSKGGKSFQDREAAAKLRNTAIAELTLVVEDAPQIATWSEYKKQMLLRLAPSLLPRLNEHTGEDGGAIQLQGVTIEVRK